MRRRGVPLTRRATGTASVEESPAQVLGAMFLGYAAILATPGPNMLAIGGIAATQGFVRALPICLGLVAGAAALAGGMSLLAAAGDAAGVLRDGDAIGRALGAALLAWLALSHACLGAAELREGAAGRRSVAFGAGFCTAATNPLTMAFFAAQAAVGPPLGMGERWLFSAAALIGVVAMALGFYLGMAALMARPAARRAVLAWQRPIRLAAAGALLFTAGAMLLPLAVP